MDTGARRNEAENSMSRLFRDFCSNDPEGARHFESHRAPYGEPGDEGDADFGKEIPQAMTVGQLIDALAGFDENAMICIAYAHNGQIGYSDLMSVTLERDSVQLNELEYFKDGLE